MLEEEDTQRRATDTWLQNDVVGITETHARAQHEVWAADSTGRFLCGEIPPDSDPAGGVGTYACAAQSTPASLLTCTSCCSRQECYPPTAGNYAELKGLPS